MSFEPCHIEYDLSRRQRLTTHLEVWTPLLFVVVLILGCSTALIAGLWLWVSPWFVLLSVVPLWLATPVLARFLVGLVKGVFIPLQHMDIIVEETALGFMAGGERFWVFLDGITRIQKHSKDTWTILHHNGTVINIPVSAIDERYIEHMRAMAAKGKTREGIQAAVERGRRIMEIEKGKTPEGECWEDLREGAIPSDLREGLEAPPEGVFRTDLKEGPVWRSIPKLLLAGAAIGLCFWLLFDRNLSWGRLLVYGAGGAVALCGVALFPPFRRSLVEIRVTADGFTVVRKGGTKKYAWCDLEAARFQDYPVVIHGASAHSLYFLFRADGKNVEIELGEFDASTRRAFHIAAAWYLHMFDLPKQAPAMPSFGSQLSCVGAWVFVGGAFGMLVAHLLAYHTLGTVFGLAVMAAGTVVAFMTRKERLSRLVLAATAALLLLGGAFIWAFDINVRDVLNAWEMRERRLGRAPWSASEPKADGDEEAGPPRPATKADSVNERGERGPTPPASVQ